MKIELSAAATYAAIEICWQERLSHAALPVAYLEAVRIGHAVLQC